MELSTRLSRPSASAEGWLQKVGGLTALPRLLSERGLAPSRVLRAAGLEAQALARSDRWVPYAAVARSLAEAVRSSRCPHFGLLVGRETRLADLGAAGALMLGAPTVGAALRAFTAHQGQNSAGGTAFLQEHERSVCFGYAVFHPDIEHAGPVYDVAAAVGITLMRELCGPGWCPSAVELPHRRSSNPRPYEQLFRCPVRFDADHFAMRFPAHTMDLPPQRGASPPPLARALQLPATPDDALRQQLYRSLRLLLLEGATRGEQTARALGLHRRTLGRRLQAQGLCFRAALDDVRYGVARELLSETDLSVVEIALTLGYAEASPFVRAFKRWSGVAPLGWRARQRQTEDDTVYAWPAATAPLRRA